MSQRPSSDNHGKDKRMKQRSCSTILPPLLLLLITGAIFLPVCSHDFLNFDDPTNLTANALIPGHGLSDLLHFWLQPYANLYIPLTYNAWALTARISGAITGSAGELLPWAFHALNLLVHMVNVYLVYLIIGRLVKNPLATCLGTLFFALHPMQVEAVAWISEFRGLFSAAWSLLCLYQFILLHQLNNDKGRQRYRYILATIFLLLALLSKPSSVVVPLLAALIGFVHFRLNLKEVGREIIPWLLMTVPAILMTKYAQAAAADLNFQPEIWQRLLIAGDSLSFYFYKLLLPLGFSLDYGRTPEYVLARDWVWLSGLLPLLFLPFIIIRTARRWILPLSFMILALLPVLGLIPFDFQKISTVTDRYMYLAMIGPGIGFALIYDRYFQKGMVLPVLSTILVALALITVFQIPHWRNDFTINNHTLRINPNSWLAANNLGYAYYTDKQPLKAIPYFQRAITLNPGNLVSQTNLGDAQFAMQLYKQALISYQQALSLSPRNPWLWFSLGETYLKLREYNLAANAFSRAISSKPDFPEANFHLGRIYMQQERHAEAERAFRRAISQNPEFAAAYLEMARLYLQTNRPEEADRFYRQGVARGMSDSALRERIDFLLMRKGY